MNDLTSDQVGELSEALDRAFRRLERSMRTTQEALRPVELDQTAVGRLSRIDELQNQALTRNLWEREQAELGQVQSALARIEAGTYGACIECGTAIPFDRLEVFPEVPTCGRCDG